jgi:hypothetical protein
MNELLREQAFPDGSDYNASKFRYDEHDAIKAMNSRGKPVDLGIPGHVCRRYPGYIWFEDVFLASGYFLPKFAWF